MISTALEKPILFSTPMVQAILEGRKTQTRRIIKPQPNFPIKNKIEILDLLLYESMLDSCPYGKQDGRLWVRETWGQTNTSDFVYKADYTEGHPCRGLVGNWKPSIHMPRKACRLLLEIQNIRVQRLQDISEEDALAEGIEIIFRSGCINLYRNYLAETSMQSLVSSLESFKSLWQSINGAESWSANPFVWVIEFKK